MGRFRGVNNDENEIYFSTLYFSHYLVHSIRDIYVTIYYSIQKLVNKWLKVQSAVYIWCAGHVVSLKGASPKGAVMTGIP